MVKVFERILCVSVLALCLAGPTWSQVPSYTISTVAGDGVAGDTGDGGPATSAELNGPRGVTEDIFGNLYIAEYYGQRLRKVSTSGTITTLAGNGKQGYSGDGGPATSAEFDGPYRVTVDTAGNVYIPDSGNARVRKVSPNGIITTWAGNGNVGYSGDGGPATSASFTYPEAVAFDSAGNAYIADEGANVIRKVNTSGIISTFAGTGAGNYTGDGGLATSATLDGPVGVQVDSSNNLYISDQLNSVIRKVNTSGIISTVAGNGTFGYAGDGGPATNAELAYPASIGIDAAGDVYIPDLNNYRVRVLWANNGTITTVAGNGVDGFGGDGGPAVNAEISDLRSVSVAPNGNVYIGDFSNDRVRLLTQSVGSGTPVVNNGGVITASQFGGFTSVAPGTFIEIYGANLASTTASWGSYFSNGEAPISISGTKVTINGQPAYVSYISPTQVNVLVPSISTGVELMTLTSPGGTSATYELVVEPLEPGLFAPPSFNSNGTQYVGAFNADGSFALPTGAISGITSHPATPGDVITLYGLGFGPVTPSVPVGEIATQLDQLTGSLSVSIGGQSATVQYDGLSSCCAGVYQFNVVVPNVSAGNAVPLTFTLNGTTGTQTLYIAVQ